MSTPTRESEPTLAERLWAAHPARWQVWTLPRRVILFLLAWESFAAAAVAWGIATSAAATLTDWLRFGGLALCATLHVQVTRKQDERRRSRRMMAVQVDLTGIWIFPAALLLPVPLSLLLVTLIGGQRWFNWRRPPHRFFFSLCTSAVAILAANLIFTSLSSTGLAAESLQSPLQIFAILILCGFVYAVIQAIAVGLVIILAAAVTPRLSDVIGSRTDNLLDAGTVGMGAVTAVLLIHLPPALAVIVLVSVLGNRLAEISQLQEEAQTDVKTGLLNMRGWTAAANRAFARATRTGRGIAVLMIDLDHFKSINDTYGHPAGDDVLRQVGRLIGKAIRPSDIVGRFGGEEFVALLVEADRTAADHAAERIRHSIATAHIATTGRRGAPVVIVDRTTSVGVAVYPDHGESLDALLHSADAAVYEAKELGRDQVRFASSTTLPSDAQESTDRDAEFLTDSKHQASH